jgi:hypothetical protein
MCASVPQVALVWTAAAGVGNTASDFEVALVHSGILDTFDRGDDGIGHCHCTDVGGSRMEAIPMIKILAGALDIWTCSRHVPEKRSATAMY